MQILTLILIGLSLSIDAFTLSMAYGLLKVPKKQIILTSLSVGLFHFLMPLIGFSINTKLDKYIEINEKLVLTIIVLLTLPLHLKLIKKAMLLMTIPTYLENITISNMMTIILPK